MHYSTFYISYPYTHTHTHIKYTTDPCLYLEGVIMKALQLLLISSFILIPIGCGQDTTLPTIDETTELSSNSNTGQTTPENESSTNVDTQESSSQKTPPPTGESTDTGEQTSSELIGTESNSSTIETDNPSSGTESSPDESSSQAVESSVAGKAPQGKIEAEDFKDKHPDIKLSNGNKAIGWWAKDGWLHYTVDLGDGANVVTFDLAKGAPSGEFEIRLGSKNGKSIGTISPDATGGWDQFEENSFVITETSGEQEIYLVGTDGGAICDLDNFQFKYFGMPESPLDLTTGATDSTITLTWSDNSNNETGFNIYVSKKDSKPSRPKHTVPSDTESYTIESLRAGTEYTVWVSAANGDIMESDATSAAITTPGEYIDQEDFTIVIIPDTQFYIVSFSYGGGSSKPEIFYSQTDWILNNAESMNIKFASHVGDIVENGESDWEWGIANEAMSKLDDVVPYGIAPGNHDGTPKFTTNYSLFNNTFSYDRYKDEDWYGDGYPSGQNTNSYQVFEGGGMEFMIFHLETWPPDGAVEWASNVVSDHPDKRVIITTHDYGTDSNIWRGFAAKHSNVFMINYGHQCAREDVYTQTGDAGNIVNVSLSDYQCDYAGGNGVLRYYTFKPSENKVYGYTYSPWSKEYESDWNSEFQFDYQMN